MKEAVGRYLQTINGHWEQLLYFRNGKRCTRIFVTDDCFGGVPNQQMKKKKYWKEEENTRRNHSFVPRPYRARNDRLFFLSLPSSPSLLHAWYKLTLIISSISGTSPLLVPFSWLSSAILKLGVSCLEE